MVRKISNSIKPRPSVPLRPKPTVAFAPAPTLWSPPPLLRSMPKLLCTRLKDLLSMLWLQPTRSNKQPSLACNAPRTVSHARNLKTVGKLAFGVGAMLKSFGDLGYPMSAFASNDEDEEEDLPFSTPTATSGTNPSNNGAGPPPPGAPGVQAN